MPDRRTFLKQSIGASALLSTAPLTGSSAQPRHPSVDDEQLKAILKQPVLKRELFPEPVIIESLDLLKQGKYYVVRARSTGGAEGYAVANEAHMQNLWPVFLRKVAPFFQGKDARDLDQLIYDCFIDGSSYKYQSLAIWVPIASAEFALLDLLGHIANKPVGELAGTVIRTSIDAYRANNYRGQSAEDSVRQILERHKEEQSRAIKIKLGGRMNIPESPPGRTERLIPLVREAVGDDVTIYADANGSYNVDEAIRVGRMLEEINAAFYEEPCPFDQLWETREVGDALDIPIAGGEQESSIRRFRWMVANDGVQVFQPDILYFGGFIRSIKVARMANAAGKPCTPHMSGAGLGMLYVLHFASIVPDPGPFQEYKGANREIPFESTSGLMEMKDGKVNVPTGPGLGVRLDPTWIRACEHLTLA